MSCPKCGSDKIYRKAPQDLTIHCELCHHHWQVNQSAAPLVSESFYLSKPIKGRHHVQVWYCEKTPGKYSYRTAYGNSFFNDLKGEFDTVNEALEAGTRETKGA